MKFTAAVVLAAAAGVSASYGNYGSNATVTTEVVDVYTTYCPGPTQITHGSMTYTVTEATTLTITDCPCTITKPIVTSSVVACHTCGSYSNTTTPTAPVYTAPAGTGGITPTATPTNIPTAGAATLSGAGLAGIVALAAFVL